ncbi:hypothetical protein Tco_0088260 [Tanacetum coccineum]
MPMMKEKKPVIDLNAECSLEITEDVELDNITESQTPDKFDISNIETGNMNMSEHADQKMGGNYSYVGYRPTFSKVVSSEYGLRHVSAGHGSSTLVNTGYSGSLGMAFVSHIPRTKFILDFENSAVRLPTVNDDGGGSFFGSDIFDNQIVMDFEHSRVYMLSAKGGVTNIASAFTHPKGYTLAFDGTISPQTYPGRNETDRLPTYFEFPAFNCLSSLYSSEAQYNTIWHNKCVQYYRDVGSIATPGESSFKLTDRENEQPQLRLAKEQSSSGEGVSSMYVDIGAMCPSSGDAPRFLQLYIYDTEHEVANRMRHFRGVDSDGLDPQIVQSLIAFLDQHNKLVQNFRTTRDKCRVESIPHFKLRLYSCVGSRQYDLPTSQTLGAIVFENGPDTSMDYDMVIEARDGDNAQIIHVSMALFYVYSIISRELLVLKLA